MALYDSCMHRARIAVQAPAETNRSYVKSSLEDPMSKQCSILGHGYSRAKDPPLKILGFYLENIRQKQLLVSFRFIIIS